MSDENTIPLISKTAFSCPHCSALTTQYWYEVASLLINKENRTPNIPTTKEINEDKFLANISEKARPMLRNWGQRMVSGKPFFSVKNDGFFSELLVFNCNISKCYNCEELCIWIHDRIVYPNTKIEILPNRDFSEEVSALFEEAREIVGTSPKGAAALLRLCIQHLCVELGESGKNLHSDIKSLEKRGLNPTTVKALHVVRVIGNESVHPGKIDLNDNKDIAVGLFELVNLICEQMISHPKQVDALYNKLPPTKREGIERRKEKAKSEE